jgi:hypothetical protein
VIPVISKVSTAAAPDVLLPTRTAVMVPELVTVALVKEKCPLYLWATRGDGHSVRVITLSEN